MSLLMRKKSYPSRNAGKLVVALTLLFAIISSAAFGQTASVSIVDYLDSITPGQPAEVSIAYSGNERLGHLVARLFDSANNELVAQELVLPRFVAVNGATTISVPIPPDVADAAASTTAWYWEVELQAADHTPTATNTSANDVALANIAEADLTFVSYPQHIMPGEIIDLSMRFTRSDITGGSIRVSLREDATSNVLAGVWEFPLPAGGASEAINVTLTIPAAVTIGGQLRWQAELLKVDGTAELDDHSNPVQTALSNVVTADAQASLLTGAAPIPSNYELIREWEFGSAQGNNIRNLDDLREEFEPVLADRGGIGDYANYFEWTRFHTEFDNRTHIFTDESLILRSTVMQNTDGSYKTFQAGNLLGSALLGKFEFARNAFVVTKVKLPASVRGRWPAAWVVNTYGGWPGELDITEAVTNDFMGGGAGLADVTFQTAHRFSPQQAAEATVEHEANANVAGRAVQRGVILGSMDVNGRWLVEEDIEYEGQSNISFASGLDFTAEFVEHGVWIRDIPGARDQVDWFVGPYQTRSQLYSWVNSNGEDMQSVPLSLQFTMAIGDWETNGPNPGKGTNGWVGEPDTPIDPAQFAMEMEIESIQIYMPIDPLNPPLDPAVAAQLSNGSSNVNDLRITRYPITISENQQAKVDIEWRNLKADHRLWLSLGPIWASNCDLNGSGWPPTKCPGEDFKTGTKMFRGNNADLSYKVFTANAANGQMTVEFDVPSEAAQGYDLGLEYVWILRTLAPGENRRPGVSWERRHIPKRGVRWAPACVGDYGGANATENDSDCDGAFNSLDAFPLDSTETLDTDGDGVGDNADALPDDPNETVDTDGDGVGDNGDVFPEDPTESADTDGDGVGDNADVFPSDPTETLDTDGDGVGDNSDAFPMNPDETLDTDGDGVGDNADVFPIDSSETVDWDNDGIGDNADYCPLGSSSLLANGSFEVFSATISDGFIDALADSLVPGWSTSGGIPLLQGGVSLGGSLELWEIAYQGITPANGDVLVAMDANIHRQIVPVVAGDTITWEFSHRGRGATDTIQIEVGLPGNTSVQGTFSSAETSWSRYTGQYSVPDGANELEIVLTPLQSGSGDIQSSNLIDHVVMCTDNAAAAIDSDGDTVFDNADNCTQVPNSNQIDTDADGFGNQCDADFDNNGNVGFADLAFFRAAFQAGDPIGDLNGDGVVGFADLARFRALFGAAPGPGAASN